MGKCKENVQNVRMLNLNVLVYIKCKSYILAFDITSVLLIGELRFLVF